MRRIDADNLTGDGTINQHAYRGQVLLDA